MCAIAEIRVDAIVTLHDIQVKNVAKLALFFEDLQIAASRARANGILVGTRESFLHIIAL